MKLFGIKSEKDELYFQFEKCKEVLHTLYSIEAEALQDIAINFEDFLQGGLPEKESYFSFFENGVFIALVITKERVHLIIKGVVDNKKIKEIVSRSFEF